MIKFAPAVVLAVSSALLAYSELSADAATFSVIYKFDHPCCGFPLGRLDFLNGALFGTGAGDGNSGDYGQLFELTKSGSTWTETSLHIFASNPDGQYPAAGLIHDSSGDLFGTTSLGGIGSGTVFKLWQSGGTWKEAALWGFGTSGDAANPECDLIQDSAGNLYGTSEYGGAYSQGAVFVMYQTSGVWSEYVAYSFTGGSDGGNPYGGLVMDSSGNLYGTTTGGGNFSQCLNGCGTAFELTLSGGTWYETTLHTFGSGKDGEFPRGSLIRTTKGVLYGTTQKGGANGDGTVFKLVKSKGVWNETVLHDFTGSDGAYPNAKVTLKGTGTLYGTTNIGGTDNRGTVFKLVYSKGAWHLTTLHSFNGNGGEFPDGGVVLDSSGNLYGTTYEGGDKTSCKDGCGTVWEVTP